MTDPEKGYSYTEYPYPEYVYSNYYPQNPPNFYSIDSGYNNQINSVLDQNLRLKFMQKVYLVLTLMILWTSSIVAMCFLSQPIYNFILDHIWIFYTSIALYFVLFIVLICSSIARKRPWNYFFSFLFSTSVGILLGTSIPGNYDGTYVLICLGITLFITFTVSLYACQTRRDFTTKGGLLYALLIALLVLFILQFFMRDRIVGLLISVFGAFLMTAYIIFDTQIIVGGQHRKYQLGTDEHIFATLILYVDILNLFLFILNIGGKN